MIRVRHLLTDPASEAVLDRLVTEAVAELDRPHDLGAVYRHREYIAALGFQIGLVECAPDPVVEARLIGEGLLLRAVDDEEDADA